MRRYLALLEERGLLRRIRESVDPRHEISAHLCVNGAGPALRFERVAGSEMSIVGNLLCSRERIALGLGTSAAGLQGKIVAAIRKPSSPRTVARAPCQEVVEENPDLGRLPIPTFFEHETGPYLTAGIIAARDLETGQANLSYARLKPLGGNRAFIGIAPNHHLAVMARRALQKGNKLPIAVTLGNCPAVSIAAALYLGFGEDELRVAGALCQEGMEVVQCKSAGILVPSRCELVLEGILKSDELIEEGPVSEYHGMYENYGRGYAVEFSHLTRRRDALLQVIQPGYYPEHVWIGGEAIAAGLLHRLSASIPEIIAVAVTPGGAGRLHAVLAVKGEARKAMFAAWQAVNLIKMVTVVDDDVDPWDATRVELAIATRMRAERDVVVVPAMPTDRSDPLARNGRVGKLGLDATTKAGYRADWTPAEPPAAVLERVRRRPT